MAKNPHAKPWKHNEPFEVRFWRYVQKTEGCWLWTGATKPTGHGQIGPPRQATSPSPLYAHRVAYELEVGPIPEGYYLHHLCEVPTCVRPDHLQPVPAAEHQRLHLTTQCIHGHRRTVENTRIASNGGRFCRDCERLRGRRRRQSVVSSR